MTDSDTVMETKDRRRRIMVVHGPESMTEKRRRFRFSNFGLETIFSFFSFLWFLVFWGKTRNQYERGKSFGVGVV